MPITPTFMAGVFISFTSWENQQWWLTNPGLAGGGRASGGLGGGAVAVSLGPGHAQFRERLLQGGFLLPHALVEGGNRCPLQLSPPLLVSGNLRLEVVGVGIVCDRDQSLEPLLLLLDGFGLIFGFLDLPPSLVQILL